jgi:thiamine-phosphate pyrophosphorylase
VGRPDPGGTRPRPLTPPDGTPVPGLPRVMLVTDRHETHGRDLVDVVAAAVAGGVRLVQVRERDLPEAEVAALLRCLIERLRGAPVDLLVNGHAGLARTLGTGLHLPAVAPRLDPPKPALYGRAAHDEDEARRALAEGVTYLVVGPVFPTGSKPGHPGAGLETLARLAGIAAPTPVFAIGGLTPERVGPVLVAGAHGVAVRSGILGAQDPARAAQELIRALPSS